MNDDLPTRPAARLNVLPLDELGLDELATYADELRAEIARVEAMAARKRSHRDLASSVFGAKP